MEALGMTRVVIENGRVVEVGTPRLSYCPLFEKYRGIRKIDPEAVRKNIQQRIDEFGLFTAKRDIEFESFVGFGASEIFMSALIHEKLDAVVCVCEGVGTVITSSPSLVQGIGARISGIVETTPIEGLVERVVAAGGIPLDAETARIDQVAGLEKAIGMGHTSVGVTVASVRDAERCRQISPGAATFLVHTTGIGASCGDLSSCDLVTACASRCIRDVLAGRILMQAGSSIPVFALSGRGKELILSRLSDIKAPLKVHSATLPDLSGPQPQPLL